ncbi:hypothetical protein F5Y00DRAFT_261015 [Daldinia vernicosa]|uniref:uncharacterized protein n=1 Tax=Daldinia vernicosa TaxID=114800 RepID=UPI002007C167|nr:uncharacterized protein F5Y00DRAFT_261015 [Daldinia vernicosa]KAI0849909.1 hypothetical protein F5Y00DRAFT_261015 [Daldinia vernicosa]
MEQSTPRSFLDLPAIIRRRIYCLAGLVTNTDIHVGREERREIRRHMELQHCKDIPDLTFSLNLLITCRAIYKEVSSILFSTNCFCTKDPQSLCQLPASFISSLSSLKFSLNAIYFWDCCGERPKCLSDIKPIVSTIPDHRSLLERWENTARFIGSRIETQNLKLGLICDVDDEETAYLAVKPLRYLHTLSSCEIRLSNKPNSRLENIARKAALHALGQRPLKQPPESFPFLRLPLEIQLEILEYTDLVTPLNHVQWTSLEKYHLQPYSCEEPHEPPAEYHARIGSVAAVPIMPASFERVGEKWKANMPPLQVASAVYDMPLTRRIAVVGGLRHHCSYLRSLEISLYSPDLTQWMQTVQSINDKLINLQYLFLQVSLGFLPSWPDFPDTNPYPRPTLAEERGIDIVREAVDLLWPVRHIGSPSSAIRLFFVNFCFEGPSIYYYKRREQEYLPTTRIYMDITDIQSVEVHVEREVCSDLIGEVDGSSLALKSKSGVWVEGILARPDFEAYEGFTYE